MYSSSRRLNFVAALQSGIVLWTLCWSCSDVSAFQPPKPISFAPSIPAAAAAKATAAATLAVLLTVGAPVAPAFAAESSGAVQVMIDQVPPSTISIQVGDIPVVGSIISGTYTKLDANIAKQLTDPPSIVISSPKDKFKAIRSATADGHLEVDIGGKLGLTTHLDVDIAADEAGVAKIRIASNLIPPLPFKNLASEKKATGGKESQWNVVTNMGSGASYYYNKQTGAVQYEKPDKF